MVAASGPWSLAGLAPRFMGRSAARERRPATMVAASAICGRWQARRPDSRALRCARASAGDDGGCECDPVVLCPRRAQSCPRPVEHVAGSRTEDPGRLRLDGLRIEEVNLPAALMSTLGEHLAVHDRVGPRGIRLAALDGDVV